MTQSKSKSENESHIYLHTYHLLRMSTKQVPAKNKISIRSTKKQIPQTEQKIRIGGAKKIVKDEDDEDEIQPKLATKYVRFKRH